MKTTMHPIIHVCCLLIVLFGCRDIELPPDQPPENGTTGAFSEIRGTIEGTLKLTGSPYRVIGSLYVDSLKTLAIEPGVRLYFQDSTSLTVRGRILCIGTPTAPILFTSYRFLWQGVVIRQTALQSIIQFAVFENISVHESDSIRSGSFDVSYASVTIQNCIFRSNKAYSGGGISLIEATAAITNNLFTENLSEVFGGAIFSLRSSAQIFNNTIVKNHCINQGGGIVLYSPQYDDVQNNIFYQNTSRSGDLRVSTLQTDTTHFRLQYNFLSADNLNPRFRTTNDYHLSIDSPCINMGNPDPTFNDFDGSRNDQGAYGGPRGNW